MSFVGQKKLLSLIDKQIESCNFPRFSIICGYTGYGKKSLCSYIAKKLNCDIIFFDNKIEDVRRCIEMAYSYPQPILYVIKDAQEMSVSAKNSLLKVAEEPPENSRIILLATLKEFLLGTVSSRGVLYQMEDYTKDELQQFILTSFPKYTMQQTENIVCVCSSPGEIISCSEINLDEMLEDCDNIVNNLHRATLSNILKITKTIKTSDKEETDGYPLVVFLNCLQNRLRLKVVDILTPQNLREKYVQFIDIIANNKRNLFSKSVNKSMLVDSILIEAYELWNCGN